MSSSPAETSGEPVELFLIGRTLRGTLGEAFRRDAIARFESRHGGGGADGADGGLDRADGTADARPLRSGLSRTVELTAVAVTRAGAVAVDLGIADPVFRSQLGAPDATAAAAEGEAVFEVAVDELDGVRPVAGPPGVDRSRRAVVRVRPVDPRLAVDLRVTVVPTE
ncbi:hypothetical protein ACEXQE_11120 [Herbiconiux sp. P17]|uniref:hypothetical protein n=1 Tax=Herbiconiux wuyangfengii TaxID=3342794 RepID=UPI0035B6E31B